jgi:hypothetical protein
VVLLYKVVSSSKEQNRHMLLPIGGRIKGSVDLGCNFMHVTLACLLEPSTNNCISSSATMDKRGQYVLIDHTDGFSAYLLSSGDCLASYTCENNSGVPKQACFGEDNQIVVTGSDHGKLHLSGASGGTHMGTLKHASNGKVQWVTVSRNLYNFC